MVVAALICFAILLVAWIFAPDAPQAHEAPLLHEAELASAS